MATTFRPGTWPTRPGRNLGGPVSRGGQPLDRPTDITIAVSNVQRDRPLPPVPVEDWLSPYYKVELGKADRQSPVMFGSMYVHTLTPTLPREIVSKAYADAFTSGGINSIWQPYAPGRWFAPNFGHSYTTQAPGATVAARVSLAVLSKAYTFDQFGVYVVSANPGSVARCGVYRVSQSTLLPTSLLFTLGTIDTSSIGAQTTALGTSISMSGLVGFVVQVESGSTTIPTITCDNGSGTAGRYTPYGLDQPATLAAGSTDPNWDGYALARTSSLSAGTLPSAGSWTLSHLAKVGSGLLLRREA